MFSYSVGLSVIFNIRVTRYTGSIYFASCLITLLWRIYGSVHHQLNFTCQSSHISRVWRFNWHGSMLSSILFKQSDQYSTFSEFLIQKQLELYYVSALGYERTCLHLCLVLIDKFVSAHTYNNTYSFHSISTVAENQNVRKINTLFQFLAVLFSFSFYFSFYMDSFWANPNYFGITGVVELKFLPEKGWEIWSLYVVKLCPYLSSLLLLKFPLDGNMHSQTDTIVDWMGQGWILKYPLICT